MKIGKYDTKKFVAYVQRYPEFMDKIMRLYNDFNIESLSAFLQNIDFDIPPKGPLTHKRYIENKKIINGLVTALDAYPEPPVNQAFLLDEWIKKIYHEGAKKYDSIWGGFWNFEKRKEIVNCLSLKKGDKILEVGVGTGSNLVSFPDYCEITGIDFCQEMLDIAREKVNNYHQKKISLKEMDASNMEFEDNTFDGVLCFYTLCASSDPLKILQEISRVCKSNRKIVIFDVIKSDISEVALVQFLFRPVAKILGAIYLEFSPPNIITYDAYFDLFGLLSKTKLDVEKKEFSDPYRTVVLTTCNNRK